MSSHKTISKFLDKHFHNQNHIFLYHDIFLFNDKRLLQENRYKEFAEQQIKKAKNIIWVASLGVLILSFNIGWGFIQYGTEADSTYLILGSVSLVALIGSLVKASQEYYTIKSSMSLLLELTNEKPTPAT